jgi:hypothetical protein
VDANQEQIVSALRAANAYVWIIGLPVDLLVGYKGNVYLLEIKDGPKKKLTKLQLDFFDKWTGAHLHVVTSPDDALKIIGAL